MAANQLQVIIRAYPNFLTSSPLFQSNLRPKAIAHVADSMFRGFLFHFLNWVTLGAVAASLRDLWQAQGQRGMNIRRDNEAPLKSWERYFDLKKEDWRAAGVMVLVGLNDLCRGP